MQPRQNHVKQIDVIGTTNNSLTVKSVVDDNDITNEAEGYGATEDYF